MLFDSAASGGAKIMKDPGPRAASDRGRREIGWRGGRGGQTIYLSATRTLYYGPT